MSIDILHEKIRKLKNPSMVDFAVMPSDIPPYLLEEEGEFLPAYGRFCRELMAELKGFVPAVRFGFDDFVLYGHQGSALLSQLLKEAASMGFYVLLDSPSIHSPWAAERSAQTIFGGEDYPCDGLVISPYIGADAIRPFVPYCKNGKDLFVVLRSPNKSAGDLQDLMTGSRLVHSASADIVNRLGESIVTRCGYSNIGGLVSAGSPNSIRNLRTAYKGVYLLVDGLDYPSGNHKNCSHAFDRFGYGAVVSAGPSVTAAWKESGQERDYVQLALQAAERMKTNLTRYVKVL